MKIKFDLKLFNYMICESSLRIGCSISDEVATILLNQPTMLTPYFLSAETKAQVILKTYAEAENRNILLGVKDNQTTVYQAATQQCPLAFSSLISRNNSIQWFKLILG